MASAPIFIQAEDGTISASHWPNVTRISLDFLGMAQRGELSGITVKGERLTIEASNGRGVYALGPLDLTQQNRWLALMEKAP